MFFMTDFSMKYYNRIAMKVFMTGPANSVRTICSIHFSSLRGSFLIYNFKLNQRFLQK